MEHDEVTSPTVSMEGTLLTAVIEAQEGQDHCNRDLPLISIFHPKKIKGFLTLLIKKSTIAEKIKSFTLNNAILRLRTLK